VDYIEIKPVYDIMRHKYASLKYLSGNPPRTYPLTNGPVSPTEGTSQADKAQRISSDTLFVDEIEKAGHDVLTTPRSCKGTRTDLATRYNPSPSAYKR
jgi:hypothetical protein